ncbi:TPA: type I toxin-antitoxin system Ibs family toxin [Escherichia coli]|nr:type I toxin-antitoxin system Ibs family toxin [Escherichia coli]MDT4553140.1 type I toxin-antitoxin system Ibs family toxin [Escherichia coli]HDD1164141.1 type I toxin-antitoxin system Ibs family toxin [Escherichia coli]
MMKLLIIVVLLVISFSAY